MSKNNLCRIVKLNDCLKAFKFLWGNAKYYKLVANSFMVKTYKNIMHTLLDFANTVEHFNIAALKHCDPKTMTLIATFKKCNPDSLRYLVSDTHL